MEDSLMGAVPVRLRHDWPPKGFGPPCGHGDGCGCSNELPDLFTRWQVRRRVATGVDDDGDPTFDWTVLQDDVAGRVVSSRQEQDPDTGTTLEKVELTVWTGEPIPETAALRSLDDGSVWRIVGQQPGTFSTVLNLDRLDTA